MRLVSKEQASPAWLQGGGDMGERIRSLDWAATPIGAPEQWPQSLRSAISILLGSRAQIVLFWGPDLVAIYNDAYAPALRAKHPWALGKPAREIFPEIWQDTLAPLFHGVLRTGEPFHAEAYPFDLERPGYIEETYYDVSYDPIRAEGGDVGGIFCIVSNQTGAVLERRRLNTIQLLSSRTLSEAKSAEDVGELAAQVLATNERDVPFFLLYLVDDERKTARLQGSHGIPAGAALAPSLLRLDERAGHVWPLAELAATGEAQTIDLTGRDDVPHSPWKERVRTALALPVNAPGQALPSALLVAGVSTRRPLDDVYRHFFQSISTALSGAIANARAKEAERRRVEALAELDRAKSTFFSNVSHEFRTPLTLMLGPLDQAIAHATDPALRSELEMVRRNGLRLQKLVNRLLDFSRIEAGRLEANLEPIDVASLTAELASGFRSAIENAGLTFTVDCPPLSGPVAVDPELWEKVVFNLVSNAFKFTRTGGIRIDVQEQTADVRIRVTDTGTGIAAKDLTHVFERFRRFDNPEARTHEGSGIGLALTHEIVRLHGGTMQVQSREGKGTTFTVILPKPQQGPAHDRGTIRHAAPVPTALIDEGLDQPPHEPARAPSSSARIVWADDNDDMRNYVQRLLSPLYRVSSASDGAQAWDQIRADPPDLVIADVMMPRLDGFSLLQRIRDHPATRDLPVILLSARAGEEARVEGLSRGADDYLVKPFSARELLARIDSLLKIRRIHDEAHRAIVEREDRFRLLAESLPSLVWTAAADGQLTFFSSQWEAYAGIPFSRAGTDWPMPVLHPDEKNLWQREWKRSIDHGIDFEAEVRFRRADGAYRWFLARARPVRDPVGGVTSWFASATDIEGRRQTEGALRDSQARNSLALSVARLGTAFLDARTNRLELNERTREIMGLPLDRPLDLDAGIAGVHPEDRPRVIAAVQRALDPGGPGVYEEDYRVVRPDGTVRWVAVHGRTAFEGEAADRKPVNLVASILDITERVEMAAIQKQANQLRGAIKEAESFSYMVSHDLRTPLRAMRGLVDYLKGAYADRLDATGAEVVAHLQRSMSNMSGIVEGLLRLSHLTRSGVKRSMIDLGEIATDVAREVALKDPARKVQWIIQPHVMADADPNLARILLSNLLDNAFKFTQGRPEARIEFGRETREGVRMLFVRDNGIGFGEEDAARLFKPFSRLRPEEFEGTGLGLATVARIVEAHQGAVFAEGRPGEGTTVWFTLVAGKPPAR